MTLLNSAHAATVVINSNLPGTSNTGQGIADFIQNFYSFALIAAGILAFAVIVYGGVRYAMGAGNPSSQSEAKSWIEGALLGLLLLGGAYVILITINPNILSLQIPGLPGLNNVSSTQEVPGVQCSSCGNPLPSCNINSCSAGFACKASGDVYSCQSTSVQCTGCGTPNPSCSVDDCTPGSSCQESAPGSNTWSCQINGT